MSFWLSTKKTGVINMTSGWTVDYFWVGGEMQGPDTLIFLLWVFSQWTSPVPLRDHQPCSFLLPLPSTPSRTSLIFLSVWGNESRFMDGWNGPSVTLGTMIIKHLVSKTSWFKSSSVVWASYDLFLLCLFFYLYLICFFLDNFVHAQRAL